MKNGWSECVNHCWITLSHKIVKLMEENCTVAATNRSPRWWGRFLRLKPMCLLWDCQDKWTWWWAKSPAEDSNHRGTARKRSCMCGVTGSRVSRRWLTRCSSPYLLRGRQSARSGGRPGEPTRRCTWSRSVWPGWSGRSASPACSSRCTHLPAPPGSEVAGPRRRREGRRWLHAPSL